MQNLCDVGGLSVQNCCQSVSGLAKLFPTVALLQGGPFQRSRPHPQGCP